MEGERAFFTFGNLVCKVASGLLKLLLIYRFCALTFKIIFKYTLYMIPKLWLISIKNLIILLSLSFSPSHICSLMMWPFFSKSLSILRDPANNGITRNQETFNLANTGTEIILYIHSLIAIHVHVRHINMWQDTERLCPWKRPRAITLVRNRLSHKCLYMPIVKISIENISIYFYNMYLLPTKLCLRFHRANISSTCLTIKWKSSSCRS